MIKNFIKKSVKVAVVILVIGVVIFSVRFINHSKTSVKTIGHIARGKVVKNSQLTKLNGSGMQKVAENKNLSLSVDFDDGNIQLVNKQNGYVWRSKPTAEELSKEKSNSLWKENIDSPITFNYVNDFISATTLIGNVYNQNTKISVYKLKNGVRVYFDFSKSSIKLAYDLVLENNNLNISIPSNSIEEPGVHYIKNALGSKIVDKSKTVLLTDISVFPFFGATRSDNGNKGYLFLPDGPGAIIKFDNNKGLNSQFIGTVYGEDLSYLNKYDSTLKNAMTESKILYPVYGIVRDNNSLMGVIDKGDSNADIIGSPAGVQTGFNSAYARFTYRNKYKVVTSTDDGNGYIRYTESGNKNDRSIKYYFNCDNKANYIGMAQTYRNYLIQTKGIKRLNSDKVTPLQLNIFGGTMKPNFIGNSFVSMTTFQQAEKFLDFFKNNNVKNIDITYNGWGKNGAPVEQPNRFPASSSLGGNSGLTEFVNHSHDLGYKVYLEDNNVTSSSRWGISLGNDTITNILGNPLEYESNGGDNYLLNIHSVSKFINDSMNEYKNYGIDGIEEIGIGSSLNTDFNKNNPISRSSMENQYINILNQVRSNFRGVRLSNAMAYELSNRTTLANMPMDGSYLTILDETVPFYEIALHGLVNYVFNDYNQFSAPDEQMLKAIEYGGNVSFTVTYEPTQLLMDVQNNGLYSTQFSIWKKEILTQYRRLASALNAVNGQYITDYKKLTPDVSIVTYGENTQVVCNFSDQPFIYEGKTVKPMNFILIKGQ
ncbi:MAG: DUF5696 domain-containing protein [Bacillota bacterium]|nr:DUF5696 domain-containing protein [Bacillota bacterium]